MDEKAAAKICDIIAKELDKKVLLISAVSGVGIKELLEKLA